MMKLTERTTDQQWVENSWTLLKKYIQNEIHQKKYFSTLSFEELYTNAYLLVLHKHGDRLYTGLKEVITEHLVFKVREDVLKALDSDFLQVLSEAWNDHQMRMTVISDILMYVDRVYVPENNVDNVYNLGINIFRDQIIRYGCICNQIRDTLLEMITRERRGDVINRPAIKTACDMLMALGIGSRVIYEEIFEGPFLTQSAAFYSEESQKFLAINDISVYVSEMDRRLNEEVERVLQCLDKSTQELIVNIVKEEMIHKQMKTIIQMENSRLKHVLRSHTADLSYINKVFGNISEDHRTTLECVILYLCEQGKFPITESSKDDALAFVHSLFSLKDGFDHFLMKSFNGQSHFKEMLAREFEYMLNFNPRAPEYLSLFIDFKLKKGLKGVTEQEFEEILDHTVELFKYLLEKDLFARYYKRDLAKRLLFKKTSSDDCERNMILKLKKECGYNFTFKLEVMFKDMSVSNTIMEEFNSHIVISETYMHNVNLSVQVLTTGIWPTKLGTPKCIIPMSPKKAFDAFRTFYLSKHSGRQLTLQPHLGWAELECTFFGPPIDDFEFKDGSPSYSGLSGRNFSPRKHVLQVSTYQMCIVMLFNNREQLSFDEISCETNIEEKELIRALQPLYLSKPRILIKTPPTEEVESNHTFVVNDFFTSKLIKVKIQSLSVRGESEQERKEILRRVDEDRRHEIEAVIVRIMKARKRIHHGVLVEEVRDQLKSRFVANYDVVKRRIECLIAREYLARTPEDKNVYIYIV